MTTALPAAYPASSSRPIGSSSSHYQSPAHPAQSSSSHPSIRPPAPRYSPYTPDLRDLHPGPKNRLFLALRSTVPEEVDWALPRLVAASCDHAEQFRLETWVDSVGILQDWPNQWITLLESEVKAREDGEVVLEWSRDEQTERRATNALLVLRNASIQPNNAKIICRATFLSLLHRIFSLPQDFLLETTVKYPEPIQHVLVILQSIFPHIGASTPVHHIFGRVIPTLLLESRDLGMINLLLPLAISGLTLSGALQPLDTLPNHLLQTITLTPPTPTLDLTLDLLISLTQNPSTSRQILSQPSLSAHLRMLVSLLEHSARPYTAQWDAAKALTGVTVRNPAMGVAVSEEASRRRGMERERIQRLMAAGMKVEGGVGGKPPGLSQAARSRLYALIEPRRSIAWMHETFVYSSTSTLLQVVFWHAYRDFFQHPSTVDPLLSASEVIKNVTVAFPGAAAKVWTDEAGNQKFIIAGMGFRMGSDEEDRFSCQWKSCENAFGPTNPAELLQHLERHHLTPAPTHCSWGACRRQHTLSHLLTHLPASRPTPQSDYITTHPSVPDYAITQSSVTSYPPAPLGSKFRLQFTGKITPSDAKRHPMGVAFLSSLIIRNLARALRSEIAITATSDGVSKEEKEDKKRHLKEERFGLPIPDSILREEEEEEEKAGRTELGEEGEMSEGEIERARGAFMSVEERVLEVVEGNVSGIGQYLAEAFGW